MPPRLTDRYIRSGRFWVPVLTLAGLLLAFTAVVGAAWWAHASAQAFAEDARHEFRGDKVEALLAYVVSEHHSVADRNRAVHALGQIGDPRALPLLEELHTGEPCRHETLLCQEELRKAIDRCRGERRAARWLPFFPRALVP